MYNKKFCDVNCGEFRRDYHFSNGFSTKYCTNYSNLVPASHCVDEVEINNLSWSPFDCTFSNLHHGHNGHLGQYYGHNGNPNLQHHGHHATDGGIMESGLVSGGNVN